MKKNMKPLEKEEIMSDKRSRISKKGLLRVFVEVSYLKRKKILEISQSYKKHPNNRN